MRKKSLLVVLTLVFVVVSMFGCSDSSGQARDLKATSIANKVEEISNKADQRLLKTTINFVNKDEVKLSNVLVEIKYNKKVEEIAVGQPNYGYIGDTTLEPGKSFKFVSRQHVKADTVRDNRIPKDWSGVIDKITVTWQEGDSTYTKVIDIGR